MAYEGRSEIILIAGFGSIRQLNYCGSTCLLVMAISYIWCCICCVLVTIVSLLQVDVFSAALIYAISRLCEYSFIYLSECPCAVTPLYNVTGKSTYEFIPSPIGSLSHRT